MTAQKVRHMLKEGNMITSFVSKRLKRLWERNDGRLLNPQHVPNIRIILDALDVATSAQDMNISGSDFHKLTGFNPARWSVHVNGNWCITFSFEDGEAFAVDYEDYH
jgi:toxin HigB-1